MEIFRDWLSQFTVFKGDVVVAPSSQKRTSSPGAVDHPSQPYINPISQFSANTRLTLMLTTAPSPNASCVKLTG